MDTGKTIGLHLKDFKQDERVLVVARKHWFVFFIQIIGILILFIVPFFALPLLSIFLAAGGGPVAVPPGFGFFFISLWALVLWNMLFARFTDFYFDVWIVTNWRIIDIEQKGFFNRNVSTLLNLEHIEDVTTAVSSILGTFLNYGHLQVQTAAAHREFVIEDVADPRGIERIIRRAQEVRLGLKPGTHHP